MELYICVIMKYGFSLSHSEVSLSCKHNEKRHFKLPLCSTPLGQPKQCYGSSMQQTHDNDLDYTNLRFVKAKLKQKHAMTGFIVQSLSFLSIYSIKYAKTKCHLSIFKTSEVIPHPQITTQSIFPAGLFKQ